MTIADMSEEQMADLVLDAGVSIDGFSNQRGWCCCSHLKSFRCYFHVKLMYGLRTNQKKATGRHHFPNGLLGLGCQPPRKLLP